MEFFGDLGFETFHSSIKHLEGDRTWQAAAILETRTAAGVALSPLRLFGPENVPMLPFLDPDVLRVALSPSLYRRRGSDLYREILATLGGVLADLPSTNDEGLVRTATHRRRHLDPDSMQDLAATIRSAPAALQLLAPQLARAVDRSDVDELIRVGRNGISMYGLEAVGLFADWTAQRRPRGGLIGS